MSFFGRALIKCEDKYNKDSTDILSFLLKMDSHGNPCFDITDIHVKILLDAGADPTVALMHLCYYSVYDDRLNIAKILLNNGAKVNVSEEIGTLDYAFGQELINLLLSHGAIQ